MLFSKGAEHICPVDKMQRWFQNPGCWNWRQCRVTLCPFNTVELNILGVDKVVPQQAVGGWVAGEEEARASLGHV
jgi:hypothetical protein